ncbi:carbonic anhydrase [Alkalibacter mobilis]|uniref:carbonic anhydrase n=1 Tax=Alkalibacter mobilis TaxID=2787712 RepID=UPI0018A031D5|nr:carbonic anhydrase [Alkalibacter mobilis]MBF7097428.1 carbonic anhydrase [Alkalibacter mobilis]
MQNLLDGITKFRKKDFEDHKELFKELGNRQKPHTLFISCSDSRIDPNMITGTKPGELFIIRNIANIVPPYRESEEYLATTSAIEYAVLVLEVENIVICGHSNCGGCAASFKSAEELKDIPHTRKWLELIRPVRDMVLKEISENEPEAREWLMEQGNVVEQLKHLLTFPYIRERVEEGKLNLSGWYYIIETGEIFIYDKDCGEFKCEN